MQQNKTQNNTNKSKPKKKRGLIIGLSVGLGALALGGAVTGMTHFIINQKDKAATIKVTFELGPHGLSFTGSTVVEVTKGSKFSEVGRPTPVPETGYIFDSWSIPEDTILNENTTITANFVESSPITDQEFTIAFAIADADKPSGTIVGQPTVKVRGNQTFKSVNKPYAQANRGYRFTGWDMDEETKITQNTVIYAKFEEYDPQYSQPITITFNAGDHGSFTGYIPTKIIVPSGSSFKELNKPNILADNSYYFNGWVDENSNPISENTIFTSDLQIKATYTTTKPGEAQFTVLFNPGLHGVFSSGTSYQQVYENTLFGNVNKPAVVAYAGYTFVGWNISENTTIKSSLEATACYIVNPVDPIPPEMQVSISFAAGPNGSLSDTTTQVVQSGTKFGQLNLPRAIPDSNYMFNGWYVDTDKISDDTEICTNITLTANFASISTPTKYAITFSAGTSGTIDPTTPEAVYEGQTLGCVNHPKVTPNDGFVFVGWDTPRSTVISGDLTVTAQYIKTPEIGDYVELTFDAGDNGFINGSTKAYTLKQTKFASINAPAVIAKPGYRFTGWDISSSYEFTENKTITAQYVEDKTTADKLLVTYDSGKYGYFVDGVTKWYELTDKNTPVLNLAKPTVYSYSSKRFNGWDKKDSETITANTTITANYKDRNPSAVLCLVVFEEGDHGSMFGPLYQIVESGTLVENISKPIVYPDANYSFVGWSISPETPITGDTTLIAQYEDSTIKQYKIALTQPESSTNWTISSSAEKAKYNQDVVITATCSSTSTFVPESITVKTSDSTKNYDLTKESETKYSVTFKMIYSSDIVVSLNFKSSHPTNKIYSTIDSKDYVYSMDNLCSNDPIVLTNYSDSTDKKTEPRSTFNYELIFPAELTDLNKSNFLINCKKFSQKIDLSKCTSLTSIPAGFLAGASEFDNEIVLPSTITSIGEKFLQGCTEFDTEIDLQYIKYFGEDFMLGCSKFNQSINLNSAVIIYDSFLYGCTSFNKDLTIPSSVTTIIDNFMVNCDSMTSTITFNCAQSAVAASNHSLGTFNQNAGCYTKGIKIAGSIANYITTEAFPPGTFETYIYRTTIAV